MDTLRIQDDFRIAPTTQQGGTQTIQQSIYLTHNNPCGANLLMFVEMGLTKIRYIDLKNYLDDILNAPKMKQLFEEVRIHGTSYLNNPDNNKFLLEYLNSLNNWAYACEFPVPVDYYPGYRLRFSVFDGSGCTIWDSKFPYLRITSIVGGVIVYTRVPLVLNPFGAGYVNLYQINLTYPVIPYIQWNFSLLHSDFINNQISLPETNMAVASLLIDSANTRTFGVPRYGFSARNNQDWFGGIGYHCAHYMNIRTTPDEMGETTLIDSLFARLSIEQNL